MTNVYKSRFIGIALYGLAAIIALISTSVIINRQININTTKKSSDYKALLNEFSSQIYSLPEISTIEPGVSSNIDVVIYKYKEFYELNNFEYYPSDLEKLVFFKNSIQEIASINKEMIEVQKRSKNIAKNISDILLITKKFIEYNPAYDFTQETLNDESLVERVNRAKSGLKDTADSLRVLEFNQANTIADIIENISTSDVDTVLQNRNSNRFVEIVIIAQKDLLASLYDYAANSKSEASNYIIEAAEKL